MKIKIYSKERCPYCVRAKSFFDKMNLSYEVIDITGNEQLREEMISITNRKTVPQIFIDDFHIGGYSDLIEMHESGKLKELLTKNNSFSADEEF